MNTNTIEALRYLTPDLACKVSVLILMHEGNNAPMKLTRLMDTMYPPECFTNPKDGDRAIGDCLGYLREMMDLGWLNDLNTDGCLTLTDEGVKVAGNMREYYEADPD